MDGMTLYTDRRLGMLPQRLRFRPEVTTLTLVVRDGRCVCKDTVGMFIHYEEEVSR